MRLPENEVRRLLTEAFDQLERLWDQNPYDVAIAYATTIKEFMADHQISDVGEGLTKFVAFKLEQVRALSGVGLVPEARVPGVTAALPARALAPEAA